MTKKTPEAGPMGTKESLEEFEQAAKNDGDGTYQLILFVTGMTERSSQAIENVRRICEENLKGRYRLEVVDLYQQPEKAKEAQIIAAPTLLKSLPLPLRKLIGDMSKTERILGGLDIKPKKAKNA